MNYTFVDSPWKDESSVVTTRGVMTDAKIAKLNNATKRPAIVKHWEENKPQPVVTLISTPSVKDYSSLLGNVGITVVNHAVGADNSGAKKLRVNKIVNEKAKNIYDSSDKIDVVPEKQEVLPKEEIKAEVKVENPLEPNIVSSREEIHGRHEKTGEIPVDAIKEAVKNDTLPVSDKPIIASRAEKNANIINEQPKETPPGDMDLYNNLLHSASLDDDVSRQLQGARNQLSIEKEESKKLAEQYGEAVKELEKLKEDIETTKKQQVQQAKEELSITLKSIESLQKENLEKTSDLTSIQSEIARLKAEKRAMEESFYEDNRSYGRAA